MSAHNTVFLRLEGPLQSWGVTSRFVIRDTADVPSKSGVLGLVCAAMGLRREAANAELPTLAALTMGVRTDRPGVKITDYHTAGAGIGMMTAGGIIKHTGNTPTGPIETHVMRKEYLADAAFLVALQGDAATVALIVDKLQNPIWPPFLGRKSCPPSVPVLDEKFAPLGTYPDLKAALEAIPWRPRLERIDEKPDPLWAVVESTPSVGQPVRDVPVSWTHWNHGIRWVKNVPLQGIVVAREELSEPPPRDGRPATSYPGWGARRKDRLAHDHSLCVFCKSPARAVHHRTYERKGYEPIEDLRSLCQVCHDAVTLLEYAAGMGAVRIDPCDPDYRDMILAQRMNILNRRDQLRRNRALRTDEEED